MVPPRRRPITAALQGLALRSRYPDARRPVVHGGRLVWAAEVQPTPLSVTYTARLEYRAGRHPRVAVVDPPLEHRDDQPLPHVYGADELCLFYDEFDGTKDLIADTVVPWVSEWLYYYELWLTTGVWHGGGIHPEDAPAVGRAARRPSARSKSW